MMLLFVDSDGRCAVPVRYPCFPYSCDPTKSTCRTECQSSADCAAGTVCDLAQSQCTTIGYQCKDAFTIQASDGTQTSCFPYRCAAGSCQSRCDGGPDCGDGYHCANGTCIPNAKK